MSESFDSSVDPKLVFITSVASWGQTQTTFLLLDLIITSTIYFQSRPNKALLILAIFSALKGQNILWLYLCGDYSPDYSMATVSFLTVMCEVGWFFLDHCSSISTMQRVHAFYSWSIPGKLLFGWVIVSGAILRGFRSTCRFGSCIVASNMSLGEGSTLMDSLIAANVVGTEFILLLALLYKILEYRKNRASAPAVFHSLLRESFIRLCVCVPLGVMECLGYGYTANSAGIPNWWNWFCQTGIFARQVCPTVLATTILSTKEFMRNTKNGSEKSGTTKHANASQLVSTTGLKGEKKE
ncbi:hypothetical protein HDV06_002048 [Boothiomyces sp. JEL0866]|nr:hypothetical protein HDV06_002048 [Boothiomyces sp. JEL0866]